MPAPVEDQSHGTLSHKDYPDPSCQTYEIVMVSLCGSIFLIAVMVIAVKTIQKRVLHQSEGKPSSPTKDLAAAETVVANIIVKHNEDEQIFTAQVPGPAYIRYISEKEMPPLDVLTSEEEPDSNTTISFAPSVTPFDTAPQQ